MAEKLTKDLLRWCIKVQQCKYCYKNKECVFKRIKDREIRKNFIHIDYKRK